MSQQYMQGKSRFETDRHAAPSTRAPELRAAPAVPYGPDADVDQFWCCTAEYREDGWRHERSCARRTAAR